MKWRLTKSCRRSRWIGSRPRGSASRPGRRCSPGRRRERRDRVWPELDARAAGWRGGARVPRPPSNVQPRPTVESCRRAATAERSSNLTRAARGATAWTCTPPGGLGPMATRSRAGQFRVLSAALRGWTDQCSSVLGGDSVTATSARAQRLERLRGGPRGLLPGGVSRVGAPAGSPRSEPASLRRRRRWPARPRAQHPPSRPSAPRPSPRRSGSPPPGHTECRPA